jgi:hypothetical protein
MKKFFSTDYLGVYIAGAALVLSQLPPLYQWFGTSNVDLKLGREIEFSHNLGRVHVFVPLSFANTGTEHATIESISCELLHSDTNDIWNFVVDEIQYTNEGGTYFWARERLEADTDFPVTIFCDQVVSNEWLEQLDELTSQDPLSRGVDGPPPWCNPSAQSRLNPGLVDQALALHEEVFPFVVGQYELIVRAEMSNGTDDIIIEKQFEVSESELERLDKAKSFYRVAFAPSITCGYVLEERT